MNDPLSIYKKLESLTALEQEGFKSQYQRMVHQQELERAARVRADEQARITQMVGEWRQAVEDISKIETILSTCISMETNWQVPKEHGGALAWPSRLDQMLGELSRYRDTLMRRISDKAVDRLARPPVLGGEASNGV